MGAKVHNRFAVLLAAACVVVGCASGPTLPRTLTVAPGQRTDVSLTQMQGRQRSGRQGSGRQESGGMVFSLQNESSGDAAAVYSDLHSNPLAKVVPDSQLQALLDVFAAKGLFATGTSTVPPDARDVLAVEHGGKRWIWARRLAGVEAEATFHEAKAYFLDVYNSSTAYHGKRDERPDLKAELQRVQQGAAAAKQRLETLTDKKPGEKEKKQ